MRIYRPLKDSAPDDEAASALMDAADALDETLASVAQCNVSDLAAWPLSRYQDIWKATENFRHATDSLYISLHKKAQEIDAALRETGKTIAGLSQGIKDYPVYAAGLRRLLQEELRKRFSKNISVDILADVLEVNDPRWRGALEGYLNTRRFYLLVAPAYYDAALQIYDRNKSRYHGAGLVDLEKLRAQNPRPPLPNSLATKLIAQNPLAQDYINYLLGGVICCDTVEELRKYKTAITDEGMLYQGFVARAIEHALMTNGFIGASIYESCNVTP